MRLPALRQGGKVARSRIAFSAIFAFNAPSIFRRVFFLLGCEYQSKRSISELTPGPKFEGSFKAANGRAGGR